MPPRDCAIKIDQRLVDKIVARAQNSSMGLGTSEKEKPHDLSIYDHPDFESLALLLVSAYHEKYDLVSLFAAALEEIALEAEKI